VLVHGERLETPQVEVSENNKIDTLPSLHFSQLLTAAGKTAARARLLSAFNAVVAVEVAQAEARS
jgi:hypothetical protein